MAHASSFEKQILGVIGGYIQCVASAIMVWEIGGRRIPRQSGQVRKEAALTSSVRVACPVSHNILPNKGATKLKREPTKLAILYV